MNAVAEIKTDPALVFADRATEITEFCVLNGTRAFPNWPVPTLWAYVFFNVVDRTAFVVRERGQIAAVAIVRAVPEADLREQQATGRPSFNWRRSPAQYDTLLIAQLVGRREVLSRLAKQLDTRFPGWRSKKLFAHRGSDLVELKPDVLERMVAARPAMMKERNG